MHYLRDYAESFQIVYGAFIQLLAAGIGILGLVITAAWGLLPHIVRRS